RLAEMVRFGVTTVEAKSGYGLDDETELKQLQVVQSLNGLQPLEVIPTYMGAHAVPAEYRGRPEQFIGWQIECMLPRIAQSDLAKFVDIFCEEGIFNAELSRRFLLAAKKMGFDLKIHAEEIARSGGARLAAELGAVSADHLLQADRTDIEMLRKSGTVAVLLPATAFILREKYAPARLMIDSGLPVAVASDFNPGSCPTCSIPLLIALSCINMGMTIEETIIALTINAAFAVGRGDSVGSIEPGKMADLVVLAVDDYRRLIYDTGLNRVAMVLKRGQVIVDQ
ncbi:MAG: imidazolonepropionase, partial [Negativicutes bacterium]|nr:imidazolonepropionase [Negativicutes bacterium]